MNFDPFDLELWLLGLLCVAIFCLTIKSVAADARRRGKPPVLVVIMVLFFFPIGLIAWLLFRPKPLNNGSTDNGSARKFNLDDHRLQ